MTITRLLDHLLAANADADEFQAAGCFCLARCRRRDAAWLSLQLKRYFGV